MMRRFFSFLITRLICFNNRVNCMSWHQFLIRDLEQWQSFGHRNKVRPLLWQIHQVVIYVICKKKPKLYIKDLLPFFIGIFGVVTVCGCSGTDKRWQVAVERRQASCTAGWKFSSVHLFLCFCPSSSNQANYSSRKESRGEERRVEERRGDRRSRRTHIHLPHSSQWTHTLTHTRSVSLCSYYTHASLAQNSIDKNVLFKIMLYRSRPRSCVWGTAHHFSFCLCTFWSP